LAISPKKNKHIFVFCFESIIFNGKVSIKSVQLARNTTCCKAKDFSNAQVMAINSFWYLTLNLPDGVAPVKYLMPLVAINASYPDFHLSCLFCYYTTIKLQLKTTKDKYFSFQVLNRNINAKADYGRQLLK